MLLALSLSHSISESNVLHLSLKNLMFLSITDSNCACAGDSGRDNEDDGDDDSDSDSDDTACAPASVRRLSASSIPTQQSAASSRLPILPILPKLQ